MLTLLPATSTSLNPCAGASAPGCRPEINQVADALPARGAYCTSMTRNFPPGDIRVSDADRDAAIAELSEHFQAGRLTQEEFDERSGLALRARTGNDLSELFTDLPQTSPGPQSPQPPGPSPVPPRAPEPWPERPAERRGHPFPPVLAGVLAVIVVSNIAGDISGSVHHPGLSWVVIVVILLVIIRIARRLPPHLYR